MAESTFEAGYCQLIIDGQKSIFTLWFIGLGEIDPLVEKVFCDFWNGISSVLRVCNCIIHVGHELVNLPNLTTPKWDGLNMCSMTSAKQGFVTRPGFVG
ncbi:MAG: hypothetical protein HS120_01445 [Burkholderiales bacterium]|nr:hypothetical protein [Burkholderiales bacterium]